MNECGKLNVRFVDSVQVGQVSFRDSDGLNVIGFGEYRIVGGGGPPYEGDYEFTPTQERQIASTGGKCLSEDIIINPIPNNYGLITYNGFGITVS